MEGHIDDPFTRRKTQPTLSMPKSKVWYFDKYLRLFYRHDFTSQDLPDDEDQMTSEKLFKLEEAKKRKKEEQLKVLIDREAATTLVTVGSHRDRADQTWLQ